MTQRSEGLWLFAALAAAALESAICEDVSDRALPRFKWGQTKEKVFVTFSVRDLEPSSVRVGFTDHTLSFEAQDSSGKAYALDVELALDIEPANCHWDHVKRKDRWGDAVLATLTKRYPSPWEILVAEPSAAVKHAMDRDWTREDQSLGQPEEDAFFAEHSKYLARLTDASVYGSSSGWLQHFGDGEQGSAHVVVVAVRHAVCGQCKLADETFAAVAKKVSRAKGSSWKARVRMFLVDPGKDGRRLARWLGAGCATTPPGCRFYAIAPPGDPGGTSVAIQVRGRHSEQPLLDDLKSLARLQFQAISAETAKLGRRNASRSLVVLPENPQQVVVSAVHQQRMRLDIAVPQTREDAAALGFDAADPPVAVAWPVGEVVPVSFQPRQEPGGLESFSAWLRSHAMPLLANPSTYEDDEPYEDLGLPVARLFLDGSASDSAAREAVRDVALSLVGRVAFMERNATSKSHEWRVHGLPEGRFPAFGVALSMEYNATKHAFLDFTPRDEAAAAEFWKTSARPKLRDFLEDALAGKLEAAKMSQALPEEELENPNLVPPGAVLKLVGRQCRDVVQASETEVLIEAYDEWRRDHKSRTLRTDLLSPMLARWNITVYRLDLGYNECPLGTLPPVPAGYSGYFFVHRRAKERGKKWQKLKKHDPSFSRVLSFIEKHTEGMPKLSAEALDAELASAAATFERMEWMAELANDARLWGCIGASLVGALACIGLRRLVLRRRAAAPAARSAEPDGRPEAEAPASEAAEPQGRSPSAAQRRTNVQYTE